MTTQNTVSRPTGCVNASLVTLGAATALAGLWVTLSERKPVTSPRRAVQECTNSAARRLNCAAATLATAVLADSAVEHYRGSFHEKTMVTPLITGALSLLASLHGTMDRKGVSHPVRDTIYVIAGLSGLIGSGFHLKNVSEKPGGFCWQNLFYAAPLGAPAALTLSGLLGVLSERVRNSPDGKQARLFGLPLARVIAAVTGAGLLGTSGEAGLLHFRGAFHNPFMMLPVTAPPIASVLMGQAALGKSGKRRPLTRWWVRFTACLGYLGTAFHAVGVARSMGGWRNWRQNMIDGPPLPAPPSFTGLAIAGLAALTLLESDNVDR